VSTSEYSQTPHTERAAAVDAEQVERAKREIQGLVQEIAELSRSEIAPADFYDAMLNKVVAALAAPGGAVWTMADAGGLQLAYQINLRQTGLIDNPIGQAQHARLLVQTLRESEGMLVAPHSGAGNAVDSDEEAAANPTDFLLVLAPVLNDQGPQGVVEVFQRPGARVATQRGYLRFLLQVCEFAGDYLRARRLRHLAEKQTLWEQLETFTRTVHEKLDTRQTAYTIANEGRRLIGCDRVSVAICRGGGCPIESVSGQDTPDKRSNVVTLLGKLALAVAKTGEDVWYSGDTSDMAPQVEAALDAYVDESHTKALAVLPLAEPRDEEEQIVERADRSPRRVIGALIVEQMVDSRTPEGFLQRVEVVRTHSATALTNALEYEGLFLMPLWRTLGRATRLFRGRALPKTLAALGAAAAAIAVLTLMPIDFTVEGDGRLVPQVRRNVFAGLDDALIEKVNVDDGAVVEAGAPLVEMSSSTLSKDIADITGRLNETLKRKEAIDNELFSNRDLSEAERMRLDGEFAQLKEQEISLRNQQSYLKEKAALLIVRSPIAGQVISWKVKERLLKRPVNRQQILMEVADPNSPWELEVFMPESRIGHVQRAAAELGRTDGELDVTFFLALQPDKEIQGKVRQIELGANADSTRGNTVRLLVSFDNQEDLKQIVKVGAGATAKVHCGKASIGYVYLHDLIDFVRTKILFRL
jgi:multidrug efflux pump subunit AcrA (membrane-fusion protein)